MNKLEFNTHIKAPIWQCFDLARSIDFHKISVGPMKEETVAGCTTGLIGHNQRSLIQSKLWGFYFSTELKLVSFNPPFTLSYEIMDSHFHSIIHDYYLYDISEETVMINHFYYKVKWGLFGELLNFFLLERIISKTISKRNEMLREFAETEKWRTVLPAPKREEAIVC